jgi:hypothetical protein
MNDADDNLTIHKVSVQRTRQACGPCRRKKARCPGEKPTCSLCQRLGQRCSYNARRAASGAASGAPLRLNQPRTPDDALPGNVPNAQLFRCIEQRLDAITTLLQERLPTSSAGDRVSERRDNYSSGERMPWYVIGDFHSYCNELRE